LVFVLGLVDDLHSLAPAVKLTGQIAAACIPTLSAMELSLSRHHVISLVLTVLWIVAVVNAFNLLDNIDGLAAGTAAICAGFASGLAVQTSSPVMLLLAVCLGGASLGFLAYNFHPAQISMGDSGSLMLGYVLSVGVLCQRTGATFMQSKSGLHQSSCRGCPC
jgi:UDP-GlcNAc:undecaprenyl-phosphate GlcNAc-1-phosphate transferase